MMRRTFLTPLCAAAALLVLALMGCEGIGLSDEPMRWDPKVSAHIEGMNEKGEESEVFHLGPGDKVRVTVFGADRLSGVFDVELSGSLAMPLIGIIPADRKTLDQVKDAIVGQLKEQKLMDDPNVSVAMVSARPFYVFGEVGRSGSYPYLGGTNIVSAIATAGGFSYRAEQDYVFLRLAGNFHEIKVPLSSVVPVNPGDIIRVASRIY
jgi:protein involved in polysaccharide export with SLBB domain